MIKQGDNIFYVTKEFGHFPTKAYRITRKGRVLIDNPKLGMTFPSVVPQMVFVKIENCILQSEWEKQNS